MDKEMYKVMIAEYMRREAELKQQVLELTMENAELKDMVLDNGGDYTETDGYEVGSPSDYEEDKQLSFNFNRRAEDKVREQFNRECD